MADCKCSDDDSLPVEVIGRRLMCENTKFHVYFDHVIDKAGGEVSDYLVVAPKNSGEYLVTGVAILPIIDGQVGLIRIYRPAIRAYSWEIPHGFVDEGEDEEASALRELLEETGLVADSAFFSSLGYITPDSGILAGRVHLYVAEAGCPTNRREYELGLREFTLFSFLQLENMIECSEVQDTFTLAAWCKYQILKNVCRSAKVIS